MECENDGNGTAADASWRKCSITLFCRRFLRVVGEMIKVLFTFFFFSRLFNLMLRYLQRPKSRHWANASPSNIPDNPSFNLEKKFGSYCENV